ncbi:MAG: hypothetical protein CL797_05100 [Chromatiales bacterium]|nr:hypothetical protein [Chromatiales bacterium]
MDMSVHRYGSSPTGHVLLVLTIVLLDRIKIAPTTSELAEITRMSKSAVSRYVAIEIDRGFLEEIVDAVDRRRRRLHMTAAARKEHEWHKDMIHGIMQKGTKAFSDDDFSEDGIRELKKLLIDGIN